MKEDIRDMNFKADEIGMRIYVQSKIRADGATGSVFRFAEASFDDAVGRVQKAVMRLTTFKDAIAVVVHESNYIVSDGQYPAYKERPDLRRRIVVLKRSLDF